MNGIVLGFAELHHLLADDDTTRRRLQLAPPTSEVQAAGLSSLAARELVTEDDNGSIVDQRLVELVTRLTGAQTWVEIGFARPDRTSGVQIFDSDDGRAVVVARPFATFFVREVESDDPLGEDIAGRVHTFLAEPPAAVLLKRESNSRAATQFALRAKSSDRIEVADTPEGSSDVQLREIDLVTATAAVAAFVDQPVRLGP